MRRSSSTLWRSKSDSSQRPFYLAVLEYEGRDNPDKALTYLEAIPVSHPHHERSLIFRIHLHYQKGAQAEAKALCLSSMTLFPKQPEFRIIMAEIHEREKEYPQALDVLLTAANMWPESTTILYRLGLIYDRMDHRDQAMIMMEKSLQRIRNTPTPQLPRLQPDRTRR
jgi:hypothetical protein